MPDGARRTVTVFARLPVEGSVKTRLESSLGSASAATAFYKACAEHSFRQAARCSRLLVEIECAIPTCFPVSLSVSRFTRAVEHLVSNIDQQQV